MSLRATRVTAKSRDTFRKKGFLIDTAKDIDDLQSKVAQIKLEYNNFIVRVIVQILNEDLIQVIQRKMADDGRSEKIIRSTRLSDSPVVISQNQLRWFVISDFKAINGFPVSIMIEEGRRAFTIVPTKAKALHWVDESSGKDIFAKRANIPPFRARKFIEKTLRERKKLIQQKVNEQTERFIEDILRS
jgi:hypothetical protein